MIKVYLLKTQEGQQIEKVADAMLEKLVQKYSQAEIPILKANPYGKPFVENDPDFHFNMSLTPPWIGIAISGRSIGYALMQQKKDEDVLTTAKDLLTKDEYKNLCQISPTSQNDHFCSLCAEKESYLKYTGLGRVLPLNTIHIANNKGKHVLLQDGNPLEDIQFHSWTWRDDLVMAVCAEESSKPEVIEINSLDEI